jgi:arsenate reductase-like glutaredoxin family protein
MKNITIFALQNCDRCKELINNLRQGNISCNVIYDKGNDSLFDRIESIVKTNTYPIVRISNNNSYIYIVNFNSKSFNNNIIKYNKVNDIIEIIKNNI